jgi:ABC transport system ATP-binding/permease protein
MLRMAPDGSWALADRSANGTIVNEERVHRTTVRVNDGDTISIGMCTYHFVGGSLIERVEEHPIVLTASGISVVDSSGRPLIRAIDLSLRQGRMLAIVGSSGAGKSTLLRVLAGAQLPDEGSIALGDEDRIGFVPQDDVLHTSLTVRQALQYGAALRFQHGVSRAGMNVRVDEVIEELGLNTRADHRIDVLSGGERKRVNVGLELLTKPSLLFVDEPTSGLDPGSEAAVMSQLHQLAAHGCTVVVVTHATHCLDVFDQVLVLSKLGRVAYLGPPSERRSVFGTDSWPMIFASLEHDDAEPDLLVPKCQPRWRGWKGWTEGRSVVARGSRNSQTAHSASNWSIFTPFRQYATLTRRFVSVLVSDRKHLLLLVGQAPIISVLIMILSRGALGEGSGNSSRPSIALLSIVLGVAYMGASNAVREIVKEKAIVRREQMFGLSSWAYICSKATVLSCLVAMQSLCLVLVGLALDGRHSAAIFSFWSATVEVFITTLLTGGAAMVVGLLISAAATNVDKATAALPVVLLAMYLLSGGPSDPSQTPVLRELSQLNVAKWGLSGVAATTDLNRLNRCDATTPVENRGQPVGGQCRSQWTHTGHSLATAWSALVAITICALLATGLLMNRCRPGRTRGRILRQFHSCM